MEHDTTNSVFALQGWNMTPNVYQLIARKEQDTKSLSNYCKNGR